MLKSSSHQISKNPGNSVEIFIDSDHAYDKDTHQFMTGFIYVNKILMSWYSKLQWTIETFNFGE